MARSRARRWLLAGALATAGLLASGCTADDLPRFGWPSAVTVQGKDMQHFWSWAVIAALTVGVLVWGLMFWSFIMYRKRKNSPFYPKQTKENLPLEIVYTAVPFVMVAVLFYFTVTTENKVTEHQPNPVVTVDVTAFKWGWDFGYEKTHDPSSTRPVDNNAQGDDRYVHTVETATEVPILVLPVDSNIEYHLASRDVIHSFWVPDFVFKRDVFPDPKQNDTDYVFTNTITRTGAFVGRCAELCGTYHSAMNFEVRSVPMDVYQAYIKLRQTTNRQTGLSYTSAEALTMVGSQIPSCGQLCSPRSYTTYPIAPNRDAKAAAEPPAGGN